MRKHVRLRPIVDNFVVNIIKDYTEFSPLLKKQLFSIVNLNVYSGKEVHSLSNAVERMIESLLAFYNNKTDSLVMPKIYNLTLHEFE